MLSPTVILPLLITGLVAAYYVMTAGALSGNPYGTPSEFNEVVLYSIEYDGQSALYRKQLGHEVPGFSEVAAVGDPAVLAGLEKRLVAMGYEMEGVPMIYHLPVVEINGELMPRVGIHEIRKALRYY
ncbi:hypothetical protein BH23VER1_BH23VER1_12520 [soil metagenome]